MALETFLGFGSFFSYLILYTVSKMTWTGGSARRKAATNKGQHKRTYNHDSSAIRAQDHSDLVGENSSYLKFTATMMGQEFNLET
jgi:hypothetical protein